MLCWYMINFTFVSIMPQTAFISTETFTEAVSEVFA